jgi:ABC-type sugar transport system, ATPase component
MENNENSYILEMCGIVKVFPGVLALNHVDFKVCRGTVHALCGENGAGKSTLMNIINGLYSLDEGKIIWEGREISPHEIRSFLKKNTAMIHQELSLVPDMTISKNIFLGREIRGKLGLVDDKHMDAECNKLLREMNLDLNAKQIVRTLMAAGMQLIEIIKAIRNEAPLIIMDEPTSSLTDSEVELLFEHIQNLKDRGITVIYITHKIEEIFRIADDVTVLRDGSMIECGRVADYTRDKLIELMVGRTIQNIYPKKAVTRGGEVLRVEGLTRAGVFKNINFTIHAGEIVGIAGLVGAGRTEVVRAIFGLDKLNSGKIYMEGKEISITSPSVAIDHGIVMVPEDRKITGLVLARSIKENISLPNLRWIFKSPFIKAKKENEKVREVSETFSLKANSINAMTNTLSGGNQQKVVLSKWLMRSVKLIILDEPTRGIDVGAKEEIYTLMMKFVHDGMAVIMISSELPEILGMSDRILVMNEGRIKGELSREEATPQKILAMAIMEEKYDK